MITIIRVKHWDHQIYKALEASYQMGLSSINQSLPNIAIEIIYSSKQLEFRPPLEQIRQMYYHEMKKFIAMPNTFEGLGNASVYKKMGQKNVNTTIFIILSPSLLSLSSSSSSLSSLLSSLSSSLSSLSSSLSSLSSLLSLLLSS
jgi:hypothetical protein